MDNGTTLEEREMKEVTMRRKSRLKGRRAFIENDLSWEERKLQERIYR